MHIFNRSEIHLMSILKLFIDIFVSFVKREVIIISLWTENIMVFRFIDGNSYKGKMEKATPWK